LHAPENNAELAISAKKIISIMLAPIPVICEKMICKFSLPLLSVRTESAVTHSYGTSAVLPQLLLAKDRSQQIFSVQYNFFLASPCTKFYVQTSGWMKRFKQVHKHYRGADKSLAQPGRRQATATEDFDVHISHL
jgi:hypothetical protein